jgi:DUF1680 family protein
MVHDEMSVLPAGAIQLEGFFENDIQNSIAHWNKGVVPYAEFVQLFRTGRPKFAMGEMWGKAVRSGCMFYRYTGDAELKRIMRQTVADLLSTRRANGSISCSEVEKQPDGPGGDLWERKYVLLGLGAYYEHVERDPAVLKAMVEQADATIAQIGKPPKTPIVEQGWSANHIEASTILEPIVRLYGWTGEQRYLDFARYIVEQGGAMGYDVIQEALDGKDPVNIGGPYPKAYEMMSLFEGIIEYHRVTGEQRCREAALKLFHAIREKEITIIGNGGGDQPYHPRVMGEAWDNTALEQTNPDIQRMMETCSGVTWLKFCSQVLRLTGDPAAADEIEKYAYNGLIGAMKPQGDGFSYVNLLNGVKTDPTGWGWTFGDLHVSCCNLNGPMGLAYLPLVAVLQSRSGPVVNLYNSAAVSATTPGGGKVKLGIRGDYPRSGAIRINVEPQTPGAFTMRLRVPGWSQTTSLKVNGQRVDASAGRYAAIERRWNAGDVIELELDMRCRVIDAPRGSNRKGDRFQALKRGPVILARDENSDPRYAEPVRIVSRDGVVETKLVTPTRPSTRMQYEVPTTEGPITMVDYASVDSWSGKRVCTWLPMC